MQDESYSPKKGANSRKLAKYVPIMRIPLQKKIKTEILLKNKHTCCVCQDVNIVKETQINHINGKNDDNRIENLAVLCLDHHAKATIGQGRGHTLGQKLTPQHVRKYKKLWEQACTAGVKIMGQRIIRRKDNIEKVKAHFGKALGIVMSDNLEIKKIHLDPLEISNELYKSIVLKDITLSIEHKSRISRLSYGQTIQRINSGYRIPFPQRTLPIVLKKRSITNIGVEFFSNKKLEFEKGEYVVNLTAETPIGLLRKQGFFLIKDSDIQFIEAIKSKFVQHQTKPWLNVLPHGTQPVVVTIKLIEL